MGVCGHLKTQIMIVYSKYIQSIFKVCNSIDITYSRGRGGRRR